MYFCRLLADIQRRTSGGTYVQTSQTDRNVVVATFLSFSIPTTANTSYLKGLGHETDIKKFDKNGKI
jgi:hypothetical protein